MLTQKKFDRYFLSQLSICGDIVKTTNGCIIYNNEHIECLQIFERNGEQRTLVEYDFSFARNIISHFGITENEFFILTENVFINLLDLPH